jgi:hypothetical protein
MRDLDPDQLKALHDYAEGRLATRVAIDRIGLHDYADLIIELSQRDLPFPKPGESPQRDRAIAIATAILQPRLRRDG